jgi:4-amino-4-deoxy-L-arabinose transferase-like glycosyltransferase
MTSRWKTILWALLIVSAIPRLLFPNQPLLEKHGFRQTQTAMSVRAMLEDGIKWLDYETPIFGPPWRAPMEFPTYQVSVALVVQATDLPLDAACRITCVLWFYLSVWLLYLILRRCLTDEAVIVSIMGFYLLSPLSAVWSRTSSIEFTAVAFGLGYLYALLRWIDRPAHVGWVVVSAACGALVAVTKVTTWVAYAPLAGIFGVACLRGLPTGAIARRLPALVIMAVVPLVAGVAWVRYSDAVKAASPFTAWLTSEALSDWNYGTLNQRLSWKGWYYAFETYWQEALPYALVLLPFVAIYSIRRFTTDARMLLAGSAAGALLPMLIFFNLYLHHDYYESAIMPVLAILGGAGLVLVVRWAQDSRRKLATVVFVGLASYGAGLPYLVTAYMYNDSYVRMGRKMELATPPDKCVFFASNSWSSAPLYYANRRGCLIHWVDGVDWRQLPLEQFGTLGTTVRAHRVTGWYGKAELVDTEDGGFIYRLEDPLPYPKDRLQIFQGVAPRPTNNGSRY